jgi:hypothetical protein
MNWVACDVPELKKVWPVGIPYAGVIWYHPFGSVHPSPYESNALKV